MHYTQLINYYIKLGTCKAKQKLIGKQQWYQIHLPLEQLNVSQLAYKQNTCNTLLSYKMYIHEPFQPWLVQNLFFGHEEKGTDYT